MKGWDEGGAMGGARQLRGGMRELNGWGKEVQTGGARGDVC